MKTKFIVVDDDYINNELCRMVIEFVFPEASIKTFTNAAEALVYIKANYSATNKLYTVLFLDINMPVINGWEFLDSFEEFDLSIKDQLKIYMLSSSIDPRDKKRAIANSNVQGFLEKPLLDENLIKVVTEQEENY